MKRPEILSFRIASFLVLVVSMVLWSCRKDDGRSPDDVNKLEVVFQDSFDNNDKEWYTGSDSIFKAEIRSGEYLLNLGTDSIAYWLSYPVSYNNKGVIFQINADFRTVSLNETSAYGLYWGIYGLKEGNFFLLDRKGNCLIGYISNYKINALLPWYFSGWVDTTKTNTLTVKREGDITKYLINGELVFDEKYRILGNRNVGFYIENKTSVAIEHIEVLD